MPPRENDFDPTTWPDELMDRMSASLGQTGGRSMPQDWQRLKVTAEMKRRAELKRDGKPTEPVARPMTNVDANLEAAASPIITEPVAGQVPYRRDLRQEQIDRLVAAGSDAGTAAMVVDRLAEIHGGETPMALFDHYNNPRDNEALRQRIAAGKVADARMNDFERNYNAETGHPEYGYDEAGNAARLGRVDIDKLSERELVDRGRRAYNARDPRGAEVAAAGGQIYGDYAPSDEPAPPGRLDFNAFTEPGPETLDGRPARPPRPLNTPEEIEAYNVRPAGGLSQRDRDMMARGFAPVVTPEGVKYMRAAGDTQTVGGFGRAGHRPDLLTKKKPEEQWAVSERGAYMGPDGKPVSVLVPGPQMLAKRAADLEGRQAAYQVKKAGMDADREEAKKMWRATALLAGGSQNLNSGNRGMYNRLAMMDDENRERALLYMSPGGQAAAAVDARNAELSGRMAQQAMTAFLANNPGADPEARKRAEDLMLRDKNPGMAGAQDIADGNTASREALQEFERLAESFDTTPGGFSYDNERALAGVLQEEPYNMPQAEAEAKAYEYAEKRRWVTGGGPGGGRTPLPMEGAPPEGYAEGPTTSL